MATLTRLLVGVAFALVATTALSMPKAVMPTGDPHAGQAIYARCQACHSLAYNRTGPKHCGLIGRRAGSVPGFVYSGAMEHSQIFWSKKTLNRFLANPMKVVPGTTMGYAGVKNKTERTDLIAYLEQANSSEECRK